MKRIVLMILLGLLPFSGCDTHITVNELPAPESVVSTPPPMVIGGPSESTRVISPTVIGPPVLPQSIPVASADSQPVQKSSSTKTSAPAKPATPTRPKWVDAPPGLHGGVYETEVVVGPERSREACEAKLPPAVESAALRYVSSEFGPTEQQLDLRFATLQTKILGPTWEERVNVDGEDSVFLHAQLRFDDQLRTSWRHVIERWTTGFRTIAVVRGFGVAMGLLLIVHLILRFAPRRTPAT